MNELLEGRFEVGLFLGWLTVVNFLVLKISTWLILSLFSCSTVLTLFNYFCILCICFY